MWSKPATIAQLNYLQNLYEKSIGYCKSLCYLDQLKKKNISKAQATKEIDRLRRIRSAHGATAMYPLNWEKIKPDDSTVSKFMDSYGKNVQLIVEDL